MEPPHGPVVVHQRAHGRIGVSVPCFDDAVAVLVLEPQKVLLVVLVIGPQSVSLRWKREVVLLWKICYSFVPLRKN